MLSFEFDPGKDSLYVLMRFALKEYSLPFATENLEHWIKSLSPQQNNNSLAKGEKAQSCSFADEVGILKKISLIWRVFLKCSSNVVGYWQRFKFSLSSNMIYKHSISFVILFLAHKKYNESKSYNST